MHRWRWESQTGTRTTTVLTTGSSQQTSGFQSPCRPLQIHADSKWQVGHPKRVLLDVDSVSTWELSSLPFHFHFTPEMTSETALPGRASATAPLKVLGDSGQRSRRKEGARRERPPEQCGPGSEREPWHSDPASCSKGWGLQVGGGGSAHHSPAIWTCVVTLGCLGRCFWCGSDSSQKGGSWPDIPVVVDGPVGRQCTLALPSVIHFGAL